MALDYLSADADISALFGGELRVHRVEVDGLQAWAGRDTDGRWNWDQVLASLAAAEDDPQAAPIEAPPESDKDPQDWTLRSPVRVDALRLRQLAIHLDDAQAQPRLETTIRIDVAVSDIGIEGKPARLTIESQATELWNGLAVEGSVNSSEQDMDAKLSVAWGDLCLMPLKHALEPLGLRPAVSQHNFEADLALALTIPDADLSLIHI